MATETRKPTTRNQRKATTTNKSKNESIGKTIFLNFGFNFNGTKAKSVAYLNLNNIFYSAEDNKNSYKKLQKAFSDSQTYEIATSILHEELEKAMKKAQTKINKKLNKLDKDLSEDEKKNISIYLSANVYDSSKDDTKAKDIKF